MYWDRFDIVEAHYWWCADHHEGQWSATYARLCRIGRYFTPGALSSGPTTENSEVIYNNLCQYDGCDHEPLGD